MMNFGEGESQMVEFSPPNDFRFNRRTSKSRGKLFFRLMQRAVSTPPATYHTMVKRSKSAIQSFGVG